MGLEDLLARLESGNGAAGTAGVSADVPEERSRHRPERQKRLERLKGEGDGISSGKAPEFDAVISIPATRRLLQFVDRDPVEVACYPDATHAEILKLHPDAVAAEPCTPTIRKASAPLIASEETAMRAWLALIEETDPATIAEVIGQCQRDAEARDYFTGRAAAEMPKPDPFPDDLRTCGQCANVLARQCQAAKRGQIVASRNYEPIRDLPRRCEGYVPGVDDPDRRPGRDRWPGLIHEGGE